MARQEVGGLIVTPLVSSGQPTWFAVHKAYGTPAQ